MKPGGQDFIKPVTPWIVGIRLLCASRIILEKEKNMFAVFPLKKKRTANKLLFQKVKM